MKAFLKIIMIVTLSLTIVLIGGIFYLTHGLNKGKILN